jgi:hypothetical protein
MSKPLKTIDKSGNLSKTSQTSQSYFMDNPDLTNLLAQYAPDIGILRRINRGAAAGLQQPQIKITIKKTITRLNTEFAEINKTRKEVRDNIKESLDEGDFQGDEGKTILANGLMDILEGEVSLYHGDDGNGNVNIKINNGRYRFGIKEFRGIYRDIPKKIEKGLGLIVYGIGDPKPLIEQSIKIFNSSKSLRKLLSNVELESGETIQDILGVVGGGSKQKRRKKSRKSRKNTLKKRPRKTLKKRPRKTLKKRSKRSKRSTKRR